MLFATQVYGPVWKVNEWFTKQGFPNTDFFWSSFQYHTKARSKTRPRLSRTSARKPYLRNPWFTFSHLWKRKSHKLRLNLDPEIRTNLTFRIVDKNEPGNAPEPPPDPNPITWHKLWTWVRKCLPVLCKAGVRHRHMERRSVPASALDQNKFLGWSRTWPRRLCN